MKAVEILLVEDNEGDIVLTLEALEEASMFNKTKVARDGKAAIDLLKECLQTSSLPDLILLDVNLPCVNGHEVLQHIKQHDQLRKIPVIMLSTSSTQKDINLSYQHHANCYITKPVEAGDYATTISKIEDFWLNVAALPR